MDSNKTIILSSISSYILFGTLLSLRFYSKRLKKIYYDPHSWLQWKNSIPWKNNINNWWINKKPWINKNPSINKNRWINKKPWSNKNL